MRLAKLTLCSASRSATRSATAFTSGFFVAAAKALNTASPPASATATAFSRPRYDGLVLMPTPSTQRAGATVAKTAGSERAGQSARDRQLATNRPRRDLGAAREAE